MSGATVNNSGDIRGGSEADVFNIAGVFNNSGFLRGQGGNDTFNLTGTVSNTGSIIGNSGSDTFNLSGNITNTSTISGSGGNDTFNLSGNVNNSGSILGNNGSDTFNLSGTVINSNTINGQGGTDQFNFTGTTTNTGSILGGGGSDTVTISGLLDSSGGTVNLAGGANSVTVTQSGALYTGATFAVGGGDTLTNNGTLAPGGPGTVLTTALTGRVVQSATGILVVDIDGAAATADRINVSQTAAMNGTIGASFISAPQALTGNFTVLSSSGLTNNGIVAADTGAVEFELQFTGTDIVLAFTVDFTPAGLTPNQNAVGNYLNAIVAAGTPTSLSSVIANVLNLASQSAMAAALDQLHAEPYLQNIFPTLASSTRFAESIMSCSVHETGGVSFVTEGQCVWAKATVSTSSLDRTANNLGREEDVGGISGGVQVSLGGNWRAGLAGSYESINGEISNFAQTDGHRAQVGGVIKNRWGGTTLALAGTYGVADIDVTRRLTFGGVNLTAQGEQDIRFGSIRGRAAHAVEVMPGTYLVPMIDAAAMYYDSDDLSEVGAGGANLNVASVDDWVFSISPAVKLGTEFAHASGTTVRPYIKAGVTWLSEDATGLSSSFAGAPAGVGSFAVSTTTDDVFADVEAGVDISGISGLTLKLNYEGKFGDTLRSHAGGARLSTRF